MREALKQTKTATQIKVYPNQPHGFHADYRPSYNEEAAKDGWLLLQNWFKKYGVV